MKVWVVVGTRPEVIKQMPVYWGCQKRFGNSNVKLIGTGQHRELLDQAITHFGAKLDANFGVMKPGQSLSRIAASVLETLDDALDRERPDWVVVQGDTTSATMSALAAYHRQIRVAHNEAGLRSYDLASPFPEEGNRKVISALANLHFAPTLLARNALLNENVDESRIVVVGNSGIDSLLWTLAHPEPASVAERMRDLKARGSAPVLLTAHRRENAGEAMDRWFSEMARFFSAQPHLELIFPTHPNNLSRKSAARHLGGLKNVQISEPFSYLETCHWLKHCKFVITDSGGLQEEATTLGIRSLVCRTNTERMEAVHAGFAQLCPPENIYAGLIKLTEGTFTATPTDIYGDGNAGVRIADALGNSK